MVHRRAAGGHLHHLISTVRIPLRKVILLLRLRDKVNGASRRQANTSSMAVMPSHLPSKATASQLDNTGLPLEPLLKISAHPLNLPSDMDRSRPRA